MNHTFNINFHKLNIKINSDNPDLIKPATTILANFENNKTSKDCNITINIVNQDNFYKSANINSEADILKSMDKIGRRVFIDDDNIYISQFVDHPGISAMHKVNESYTIIYSPSFFENNSNKLYQTGYYALTLFPIARTLKTLRNFNFLHGGAINYKGHGVAFCGLQGVGKSTILLKMMQDQQSEFLSDNIYFHDDKYIYSCPETVRLDKKSIDFICPPPKLLVDIGVNSDLNRKMYIISQNRTTDRIEPEIFLIPRFSQGPTNLTRIKESPENMMLLFNELALELRSYNQWDASFSAAKPTRNRNHIDIIEKLLKNKPTYFLNIHPGDNPQHIIEQIEGVL